MPRTPLMVTLACALLATLALAGSARTEPGSADVRADAGRAIGDTLTTVMRPILSVPAIVEDGQTFTIEALAPQSATDWSATLERGGQTIALPLDGASYLASHERWFITATVPPGTPEELYDLRVEASGGIDDVTRHSVMVEDSIPNDYYFVHITDTHLPTHLYYYQSGADTDTTEMDDLRAVIQDINIINPAFVLLTGDVVNEGELEDYLDKRYFTRAKRILRELDVPVFLSGGNHDIGGWNDTPPPDGTARRNWWRFFGWRYLAESRPGENIYTQNYSFDYGHVHFVGIEAYNNYDRWRRSTYGTDSFTTRQMAWLADDLSVVHPVKGTVLFHHMDFQDQLDLEDLGVDGALYGHIHYTSGSVGASPFNLSTNNVCDGERSMRLVRVEDNVVTPSEPISAGSSGYTLRTMFDGANDGTETDITATVINGHNESFEHGRVRFRVPAASMPYEVDGGTVTHSIVDGAVATYYVTVDIPSIGQAVVSISPETGVSEPPVPALALIRSCAPNPARAGASLRYALGAPANVEAVVYDAAGRRVRTLRDDWTPAGERLLTWDLRGDSGGRVSSGAYFLRITAGGETVSDKVVVLR